MKIGNATNDYKSIVEQLDTLKSEHDGLKAKYKERTEELAKDQPISPCEAGSCVPDDDQYKLECKQCTKLFHYACTGLPTYQIAHFLHSGYRKYQCIKCTEVPDYIKEIMSEKRKQVVETSMGSCDGKANTSTNAGDKGLLISLQDILDKNASKMEKKLESLIDKKLGEKLESLEQCKIITADPSVGTPAKPKSYAGILAIPDAVKKAMQEERNETKVEESDIDRRKKNFKIHGVDEIGDNKDEIKTEDTGFVKEILEKLGVECTPKSITRLGESNESKKRPLKIVMKTIDDKTKIMSSLNRLKGTEEIFGKISIREDYTNSERDEIKTWVQKAKDKSEIDPEHIYKG